MKTVPADLVMELNVDCPECGYSFDLFKDTRLNDEAELYHEVIDDERWDIPADERLKCSPICPECSVEFDVKGVNW